MSKISRRNLYSKNYNSDIFNTTTQLPPKLFKPKKRHLYRSTSDIFNKIKIVEKKLTLRNHSQSDVFFIKDEECQRHLERERNHMSSTLQPKQSDYNPDNYLHCESAFKTKMKDIYNVTDDGSLKNIKTTKGYLNRDDLERNRPIITRPGHQEGHNRYGSKSTYLNSSAGFQLDVENYHPKENHLESMKSNIFLNNDKAKQNKPHIKLTKSIPSEEIIQFDVRKKKRDNWSKKLDWLDDRTELLLYNYNNEAHFRQSRSAVQRKKLEMRGSNIFNQNEYPDNEIRKSTEVMTEDNFKRQIPIPKELKKKAMMIFENSSSQFDDTFYEEGYKVKHVEGSQVPEHNFVIFHKGNLELCELKRTFSNKGLHVYDISKTDANVTQSDSTLSYTFKVRENNKEVFNKQIKEVEDKLQCEKGLKVCPKQYISVRRKHIETEPVLPKGRIIVNRDINSGFSKKFNQITHNYKRK